MGGISIAKHSTSSKQFISEILAPSKRHVTDYSTVSFC